MRSFTRFMALTAFPALIAYAQGISGDWQGTRKVGAQELRILLQISKSDHGEWRATMRAARDERLSRQPFSAELRCDRSIRRSCQEKLVYIAPAYKSSR
jgi:hypothetical protein